MYIIVHKLWPQISSTFKSKWNNIFWKVLDTGFGKITRLGKSYSRCMSFHGKDIRNVFGINLTVVHKTIALKCSGLNSANPQWMCLVDLRLYSRYITVLMFSKVRTKFRDVFQCWRLPTIQRPVNKCIWLKDLFYFSFASGILLKGNCEEKINLSLSVT
jgi:hypothetical protein